MKVLEMYAVYDSAAGYYGQPFFCRSKSEAVRLFSDAVGDDKSPYHKHPGDFSLFFVGLWDDNTGVVTPETVTARVISALECVVRPE